MTVRTLLVANRGEIALRVMRSARALGFRTVAIYSEADRDAMHVTAADQAVHVGPAEASQSYLSIERVIAAAKQSGATHIHPGYGFLSENADFARACEDAGINFVGPSHQAIHLMGDKGRARAAMLAAGVPCVPGYQGDDQTDERLTKEAERIGFPIMIKASSGGGGRGLRIARDRSELSTLLGLVRSEAARSFGHGSVVLERALSGVRHVEVQIFCDKHGHVIALGERDCSMQRRNQKVIEEAPSPAVTPDLRKRMSDAAVLAAKTASYVGAGTIEMLLDEHGEFYFLEMNTRLQVEHPVTEEVTGLDLVQWQLRIADGEPLPITQEQVALRGHAIEVRLYAEDPIHFMPQTGRVEHCALPSGPLSGTGIRIDHALRTGLVVSAHYDPMLGKLIAHGDTREQARLRLIEALRRLHVLGLVTNKALLLQLLAHPTFAAGKVDIGFIARDIHQAEGVAPHPLTLSIGAALFHHESALRHAPHADLRYFRSGGATPTPLKLEHAGKVIDASVLVSGAGESALLTIELNHQTTRIQIKHMEGHQARVVCDGIDRDVAFVIDSDRLELDLGDGAIELFDRTLTGAARTGAGASGEVTAPMDGVLVRLDVAEGNEVSVGQALLTIESMKLQHVIRAAVAGRVAFVGASAGAQVKRGTTLVRIT